MAKMSSKFTTLSPNPAAEDFDYFVKLFKNELVLNDTKKEHQLLQLINHLGWPSMRDYPDRKILSLTR